MSRVVKKHQVRKAEIVSAARDLFHRKEYGKATMQDLMETLGVAKGTIYHYFKSKEALLDAVIEDIVEKHLQKMRSVIKNSKGNALKKIELLIKASRADRENQKIVDYLHQPDNSALHNQLLAALLIKQSPIYGQVIQQGCDEGLFSTETPLECAEFILSAIQFLTDVGIYPWKEADLKRRIQAFPQLIEALLHAPKGSFQFLIT